MFSARESFHTLAGDLADQSEILVDVQERQAGQLPGGGHEKIGDRRGTVLCPVGQQLLHVLGTLLDGWGEVLNRHRPQRCL